MNAKLSGILTIILLFGWLPSRAADDPRKPKLCETGHILTPYKPPGYDFAATSWERAEKNAFVYRTCVENHHDTKSLYIDWMIPGPYKSYVAPGDSNVSPRPFVTHQSVDVLSCLIYGNSRDRVMARHIGHQDDLPVAKDQGNCTAAGIHAQLIQLDPSQEPWFVTDGRISLPSDSEDVDGTLIRFVYQIGLVASPEGYSMVFAYQAAPASEAFHGRIEAITMRSSSRAVQQALIRADRRDGIINLSAYEGNFRIPMQLPNPPYFVERQRYGFYDAQKKLVGEIEAPFLSLEPPR